MSMLSWCLYSCKYCYLSWSLIFLIESPPLSFCVLLSIQPWFLEMLADSPKPLMWVCCVFVAILLVLVMESLIEELPSGIVARRCCDITTCDVED